MKSPLRSAKEIVPRPRKAPSLSIQPKRSARHLGQCMPTGLRNPQKGKSNQNVVGLLSVHAKTKTCGKTSEGGQESREM